MEIDKLQQTGEIRLPKNDEWAYCQHCDIVYKTDDNEKRIHDLPYEQHIMAIPPEGYDFVGEFRKPKDNEYYINIRGHVEHLKDLIDCNVNSGKRTILKKKDEIKINNKIQEAEQEIKKAQESLRQAQIKLDEAKSKEKQELKFNDLKTGQTFQYYHSDGVINETIYIRTDVNSCVKGSVVVILNDNESEAWSDLGVLTYFVDNPRVKLVSISVKEENN